MIVLVSPVEILSDSVHWAKPQLTPIIGKSILPARWTDRLPIGPHR